MKNLFIISISIIILEAFPVVPYGCTKDVFKTFFKTLSSYKDVVPNGYFKNVSFVFLRHSEHVFKPYLYGTKMLLRHIIDVQKMPFL